MNDHHFPANLVFFYQDTKEGRAIEEGRGGFEGSDDTGLLGEPRTAVKKRKQSSADQSWIPAALLSVLSGRSGFESQL